MTRRLTGAFTKSAVGFAALGQARSTLFKQNMLEKQSDWQKYEDYTRQILNDERVQKYLEKYFNLFNLVIKPKDKLPGIKTGTQWEVDGYGYDINDQLILIECKHYKSDKVVQNTVAAFAYIIRDVEAKSGIIVTTFGLQFGAIKVARTEDIGLIKLHYNSTNKNFLLNSNPYLKNQV
ncbi:MAG TPA: restriction endonuclease [Coleofasciculaceae cyanobacterium]